MEQIETPRLLIRGFTLEDANDLQEILGDAETMEYLEPAYDLEKTGAFLESFCMKRRGAVAAVDKQTQKLIGYLLFNEVAPGEYEMGWIFNRSYWRRGYAWEACTALKDFAFRELGAQRIFAETLDSVKSVGLMQKLGMTLEEIQSGQERDLYVYALSRDVWEQMN